MIEWFLMACSVVYLLSSLVCLAQPYPIQTSAPSDFQTEPQSSHMSFEQVRDLENLQSEMLCERD